MVALQGTGTLCTSSAETEGHPYGSFVTYGLENGAPVFLVSVMAEHTQNLLADTRCSLLVAEPGDGDSNWGNTTNTSLELIGEALGYGT